MAWIQSLWRALRRLIHRTGDGGAAEEPAHQALRTDVEERDWYGVMSNGGDLRIRGLQLVFTPEGDLIPSSPTVEMRTDIWPEWLLIARDATGRAKAARESNPGPTGGSEFQAAVENEMREGLVAITAAAVALEAFYYSVVFQVPEAANQSQSAAARIHQALCRAFRMTNDESKTSRGILRQLVPLRNSAVHPSAEWAAPALHETFKTSMSPYLVNSRHENARNATNAAAGIINHCLRNPRLSAGGQGFAATVEAV